MELVFHPDRSFDKLRLDEPVQGTRVVLYKRIDPLQLVRWTRNIRSSLQFWCEHCSIPVLFDDGRDAPADAPAPSADPFAAFEDARSAMGSRLQSIQRPLDMPEAQWSVRHEHEGIIVWAGLGGGPQFSWYNGGLTLLSTSDPSCLSTHGVAVHHLRLKVQHDRLEHTLTRDNVIQDEQWERAMVVVRQAASALAEHILATHEACVASGSPLGPTLAALADWVRFADELPPARNVSRRIHLPQVSGPPRPLPLAGVLDGLRGGAQRWMLAPEPSPLTEALTARKWLVFQDSADARVLLDHLRHPTHGQRADWVLVEPVEPAGDWKCLMDAVAALQTKAGAKRPELALCRVVTAGGTSGRVRMVVHRAPSDEPVHPDGLGPGIWHRVWGTPPVVWVNASHPNVQLAAEAAAVDAEIGAYALLQAIFVTEAAVGGHASAWRAVQRVVNR